MPSLLLLIQFYSSSLFIHFEVIKRCSKWCDVDDVGEEKIVFMALFVRSNIIDWFYYYNLHLFFQLNNRPSHETVTFIKVLIRFFGLSFINLKKSCNPFPVLFFNVLSSHSLDVVFIYFSEGDFWIILIHNKTAQHKNNNLMTRFKKKLMRCNKVRY